MAKLDTITIKGFKSIAAIEKLKLGAINVVIGPNGSGKSNFIGVFGFLKELVAGGLQDFVGKRGLENVLHFGPRVTEALTLELVFQGNAPGSYALRLEPGMRTQLLPVEETVTDLGSGTVQKLKRAGEGRKRSSSTSCWPRTSWLADGNPWWRSGWAMRAPASNGTE